jgi:hypothetical protein
MGTRAVAISALAVGVVVATASPGHAASTSSSCTAQRSYYNAAWGDGTTNSGDGYVRVDVRITLNSSGNTVTSASYSFSNARWESNASGARRTLSLGSSGNVNVTSPVSRVSPDSMGTAGTYDFTNFTVSAGTNVAVQGIPDVPNISDPKCTVYIRVG